MSRYSNTITIELPDTEAVRHLLMQVGAHLVDDAVPFYEDIIEETGSTSAGGYVQAGQLINDAILAALGLP